MQCAARPGPRALAVYLAGLAAAILAALTTAAPAAAQDCVVTAGEFMNNLSFANDGEYAQPQPYRAGAGAGTRAAC